MFVAMLRAMKLRFLAASTFCHGALIVGVGLVPGEHATPDPMAVLAIEFLPPSPASSLPEPTRDHVPVPVEVSDAEVQLLDPDLLAAEEKSEAVEPLAPLPEILWGNIPLISLRPPETDPVEEPDGPEDPGQPSEPVPYVEARLIAGNNSPPDYPYRARKLRQEGAVVARISVDRSGAVTEVVLVEKCPYGMLNEAVLCAVRQWCFEPASRGGVAVATTLIQRFEFILDVS